MTEFFTGLVLGIAVGVFIVLMFIRSAVREALESADDSLTRLQNLVDEEIERTIQTRVEEHDGVYYIYNVKDGAFLVQGSTLKEVKDSIEQQFPNTNVNITSGDIGVINKLKAEFGTS
jgi:hypothetical protein